MASRSAMVLVVLAVALIAFCFAGVFAGMTGTYHLNLTFGNNSSDGGFFGNITEFNSDDSDSSSNGGPVQTYSDEGSDNSPQNNEPSEDSQSPPSDSGEQEQPSGSGNNQPQNTEGSG